MWKKIASIAALFSSAAALSACETSAGKPIECLPRFVMSGRCAKVPQSVKDQTRVKQPDATVKPKYKSKKVVGASEQGPSTKAPTKPKMNVYGQPI